MEPIIIKTQTQVGELTAVLVEDPNMGGYTAFFDEKQYVIAEGDTQEEAIKNLVTSLDDFLEIELKN